MSKIDQDHNGATVRELKRHVLQGGVAEQKPIAQLLDRAEAQAAADEHAAQTGYGVDRMTPTIRRVKRTPLTTFQRDIEQANTLIQGGWGKRGGISMHVSTTGSGKSVLQTQSALCFHQGIECCGLKPTRPFTTWVVQSEDDDDRVAFDRDCIVERLARIYPDKDWQRALDETRFLDFTGLTGAEFVATLNNELFDEKPDGVIINPMNAYFGGNLKDGADASAFFKGGEIRREPTEGLEAVLKRHKVWCWLFAHTPKPPTAKELDGWLNDPFPEYKACGASEIADAVRSVITFLKVPGRDGVFSFTAGKNGKGLGWTDANGNPTNRAFYRWSQDGGHFWERVPDGERPTIGGASETKPPKPPPPPPRDEMPVLLQVFGTFETVMPKGAAAQAVRDVVNAERCKVSPPVKPMGRNDSVALIELAIGTGKIECIEYGGTKGTLCALPSVMAEYRNQPLPGMTADKPTARKGKSKGAVA